MASKTNYVGEKADLSEDTESEMLTLKETTTPSAKVNYGKIYTKSDNNVYFQDGAGVEHVLAGRVDFKSYALATPGIAGTRYIGGFYQAPAAHSVLNQGALTQTYGTALRAKGAHAFLVASAAGTATGGSGAVTIVVSGVSITSAGVRNDADSEVIVADITAMSTDAYYETTKRWLGQVTYTLTVGATGHTAYAATFNYGFAKHDDFGNRNFVVTDFDLVVTGGATDNGFDVKLAIHCTTGWVYSAAAFVPGCSDIICQLSTDYGTNDNIVANQNFSYKRTGLTTAVTGSDAEGIIITITTTANNAIEYGTAVIGVEYA